MEFRICPGAGKGAGVEDFVSGLEQAGLGACRNHDAGRIPAKDFAAPVPAPRPALLRVHG